jgi:hypothetical protein
MPRRSRTTPVGLGAPIDFGGLQRPTRTLSVHTVDDHIRNLVIDAARTAMRRLWPIRTSLDGFVKYMLMFIGESRGNKTSRRQ